MLLKLDILLMKLRLALRVPNLLTPVVEHAVAQATPCKDLSKVATVYFISAIV